MEKYLANTAETEQYATELWRVLPKQGVVFLHGDLGAGKTTLVRGLLKSAGYTGAVKSPTYTLVEEYYIGQQIIFHFDLYRLSDPEELEWIGIHEYFLQNSLCFIEWPCKGIGVLPQPDCEIFLTKYNSGRQLIFKKSVKM